MISTCSQILHFVIYCLYSKDIFSYIHQYYHDIIFYHKSKFQGFLSHFCSPDRFLNVIVNLRFSILIGAALICGLKPDVNRTCGSVTSPSSHFEFVHHLQLAEEVMSRPVKLLKFWMKPVSVPPLISHLLSTKSRNQKVWLCLLFTLIFSLIFQIGSCYFAH